MNLSASASAVTTTTAHAVEWEPAILRRTSVRSYAPTPLNPEVARALAELEPERIGQVRLRHVLVEGPEVTSAVLTKLVGSYGHITGAPALLIFVARTTDPGHMAALGYMGEQVILAATAYGVGTCWITATFHPDVARSYVELAEDEAIIAVSPVGNPVTGAQKPGLLDRSMRLLLSSNRRKPLADLVRGTVDQAWLQAALEAARWAPSATNRQPWRFTVDPGVVRVGYAPSGHIGPGGENHAALDCGIAMANFAVAARARGVEGDWVLLGGSDSLAEFRYREPDGRA